MTTVLIGSDTQRQASITGLSVTADPSATVPASRDLTPLNSRFSALHQKPTFTPSDHYDYPSSKPFRDILSRYHYSSTRKTHGTFLLQTNTQAQTYTRFGTYVTSGSLTFSPAVQYLREDLSFQRLDERYYAIQGGGREVLVAPGAPRFLLLTTLGSGEGSIGQFEAVHASELVPPSGLKVNTGLDEVYESGPEGVFPYLEHKDYPNASFMSGDRANFAYDLANVGSGEGTVNIDIYVGYTCDTSFDTLQKSFAVQLGPFTTKLVRANLTAPHSSVPGQKPIITLVVTYPDGSTQLDQRVGRPFRYRSMDIPVYDPVTKTTTTVNRALTPEEQRRVDRAGLAAAQAALNPLYANDPKIQRLFAANPDLRQSMETYVASFIATNSGTRDELVSAAMAIQQDLFKPELEAPVSSTTALPQTIASAVIDEFLAGSPSIRAELADKVSNQVLVALLDTDRVATTRSTESSGVLVRLVEHYLGPHVADTIANSTNEQLQQIFGNALADLPDRSVARDPSGRIATWKSADLVALGVNNVRTASEAGRLFAGLVERIRTQATGEIATDLLAVSVVTQIPYPKLAATLLQRTPTGQANALRQLFSENGFQHLFASGWPTAIGVVSATTNVPVGGVKAGDQIRVKFDYVVPEDGMQLNRTSVWLVNDAGLVAEIPAARHGGFFINFDVATALNVSGKSASPQDFRVVVRATFIDAAGRTRISDSMSVAIDVATQLVSSSGGTSSWRLRLPSSVDSASTSTRTIDLRTEVVPAEDPFLKQFIEGAVKGSYGDNSLSATLGQIALGLTPVGWAGDVRDSVYLIDHWEGSFTNYVEGVAIGAGFVPGIGDIGKAVVLNAVRHGNEVVMAVKTVVGTNALGAPVIAVGFLKGGVRSVDEVWHTLASGIKINRTHVLFGEVVIKDGKPSAVGFHYRPFGKDPTTAHIVGEPGPLDKNGLYVAQVEVFDSISGKWLPKRKSTFYPDSWSESRIWTEVYSAYKSRIYPDKTDKPTYWQGTSNSGITIGGYDGVEAGTIATAYPVHLNDL